MALLHETKAEEKEEEDKAVANQEPKKSGKSFWMRGGNKKKLKKESTTCTRCSKAGHLVKDCRVNLRKADIKGKCLIALSLGTIQTNAQNRIEKVLVCRRTP